MSNSHGHGDEHDLTMWCGVRPRCARPPPRSPCISLFCMFVFLFVLSVCVPSVISSLSTPWNASKIYFNKIPTCFKKSSKIHPKTTSKSLPKPLQNPLKMVLRWYLCWIPIYVANIAPPSANLAPTWEPTWAPKFQRSLPRRAQEGSGSVSEGYWKRTSTKKACA